MNTNYYQDRRFEYNEIATLLEDCHYSQKGKFYIKCLLPEVSISNAFNNTASRASVSNIMNYSKRHGIKGYTISNYIELTIPKYISDILIDEDGIIKAGSNFIITFLSQSLKGIS